MSGPGDADGRLDAPTRIALRRYQGLLWSVNVRVGGSERTFLLDLAAGITSFDASLAAELGLAHRHSVTARRMTGEELRVEMHDGVELGLGGRTVPADPVAVLDMRSLLPPDWPLVDGALAVDVLEDVPFTLDLARDEVVLETPSTLARRVANGSALRVRLERQVHGVSLDVMVAVEGPERTFWFELDNSNTGPVILAPECAEALGVAESGSEAVLHIPGLGDVRTPVVRRPLIFDGNLGRTVLDGRVLTFDLSNELLVAAGQNQP